MGKVPFFTEQLIIWNKRGAITYINMHFIKFYLKAIWASSFVIGQRTDVIFDLLHSKFRVQSRRLRKDWNIWRKVAISESVAVNLEVYHHSH